MTTNIENLIERLELPENAALLAEVVEYYIDPDNEDDRLWSWANAVVDLFDQAKPRFTTAMHKILLDLGYLEDTTDNSYVTFGGRDAKPDFRMNGRRYDVVGGFREWAAADASRVFNA